MPKDPKKSSLLSTILIAAGITLAVTVVRLTGELQGWSPVVFGTDAGGNMSPLGISWLVIIFGFWFGRRLANTGSRPSSTGKGALLPAIGMAVFMGLAVVAALVVWPEEGRTPDDWRAMGFLINGGAAVCGLATLIAWPRAWLALVFYGVLARLPVIVIQYMAVENGWDVHYAKGAPGMPDDMALFGLTLSQCGLWPLGFTPLVGGLFAALGAASVKSGNKK